MTTIGKQIQEVRRRAGYTQRAIGDLMGANQSTVARIESNMLSPTQEQVARIATALDVPELLTRYCESCPVCTALLPVQYPELDNVPLHPTTVAHKGAEEAREAAEAFEGLFRLFDRLDWAEDPQRREQVVQLLIQVRDVEVAIRILYQVLFVSGLLPMSVLEDVNRRQTAKCIARGYCKPNGTEG